MILKTRTARRNTNHSRGSQLLPGLRLGLPYLERSLRRLSTSCRASFPAAWFPQHSVARARWLVRRLDTWRARPECTASVEPPSEVKTGKAWWNPRKPCEPAAVASAPSWPPCVKALRAACPCLIPSTAVCRNLWPHSTLYSPWSWHWLPHNCVFIGLLPPLDHVSQEEEQCLIRLMSGSQDNRIYDECASINKQAMWEQAQLGYYEVITLQDYS